MTALATQASAATTAPEIHMVALPTGSAGTGSAGTGSADSGSSSGSAGTGSTGGSSAAAIPGVAETAYKVAAVELAVTQPQCHMPWQLLAGIGRVESHHADDGDVDMFGTARRSIYGPALDGTLPGNEVIRNHAGKFLRAEGPMQFMPATWARYAPPGGDPQNIFDASYTAGNYLCSGGLDMHDSAQRTTAILRYNHSMAYVAEVMGWAHRYE
ncbi:lytic transglycosylase domain-containing protein [Nocardia alni]|uniref:lytic transglycosylase domain-containing protein n=1 Tax=Nocardia alni TaxID=2815723 RepID=UPI001C23B984|nr:lytic transglycosylase domain-containing protein [Nocardia alni]